MAISVTSKAAKAEITKTNPDGSTEHQTEELAVVKVPEQHATVSVEAGITRNLGNYESLRYSIILSVPCAADGDDIEETFNSAKDWVDEKLSAINSEIDDQIG